MQPVSNVSIVGLGKLGACMAACMASCGMNVIGVDVDSRFVAALNEGRAPVREPDLDEMIANNKGRLRATKDYAQAVAQSDLTFVIVPTPSDERGGFSLDCARQAFASLGRALALKEGYHVVVLTSTVLPGSMRHGLLPVLERESGKTCGPDFGLCYNPEFIALGSVLHDFLNPDFYLLGEFDARSGDVLEAVHRRVSRNKAQVKRMSLENAELVKIALNSAVTMKISFANMLAELAESVPGGDVDVLSDAIGLDSRIGRKYLTGGLGFGGPCFPRDNAALAFIGGRLGANCDLLVANDAYNNRISDRLTARLARRLPAGARVAVLGLAYKPHTPVVEASAGLALCRGLAEAGFLVSGYDPLAGESARASLAGDILVADTLGECLQDASAVIVTTRAPEFLALTPEDLATGKERLIVFDCWRCLNPAFAVHPGVDYLPLGRCLEPETAIETLRDLWSMEG